MGYDLKQIGAKLAKMVTAFVIIEGATVLSGVTVPAAVLALLTDNAVRQGIGELTEGAILGILPKDKGVMQRFTNDIQNSVMLQLKETNCPWRHVNTICKRIMNDLFTSPVNTLISSVDNPQIVTNLIKSIFNEVIGSDLIDSEVFINNLLSRIILFIDYNHEYTTIYYLKKIDSKIDTIKNMTEINQQIIIDINKTIGIFSSRMIEWIERDYASIQEKQVEESHVYEVKSHLDVNLRTLELAKQSDVGVTTAKRSVQKFLTSFKEIEELSINSVIAEILERCFKCALTVEKKYNLPYDAYRQYADILWSQQRVSECIEIEDKIIKELIKKTIPHSFEVAIAYERLVEKCISFNKFKEETLSYITACLSCWVDLSVLQMTDEQLIELAIF